MANVCGSSKLLIDGGAPSGLNIPNLQLGN